MTYNSIIYIGSVRMFKKYHIAYQLVMHVNEFYNVIYDRKWIGENLISGGIHSQLFPPFKRGYIVLNNFWNIFLPDGGIFFMGSQIEFT